MLRKKYQRVGKTAFFGCLALVVLLGVVPSLIREDYTSYAPSSSGQATSHQKLVNQFADDPGLQLPRLIESMDNRNVDISALRIAILEHTDWHDEVIGPVARILQELGLEYDIYRQHGRYGWLEFMRLAVNFPKRPLHFSDGTYEKRVLDGEIDVTIHITGDTMWDWFPSLLKAMRETPTHQVIPIYHQIDVVKDKDRDTWQPVAEAERLQLVTLSPRATDVMRDIILLWADAEGSTAWHTTDVNTIVPVIPLDFSKLTDSDRVQIDHLLPRDPSRPPSRLAIVGDIADNRRRYNGFIQEMFESIQADPATWGYQLSNDGTYIPDPNSLTEPVKLFLIGSLRDGFTLTIPEPIKDTVEVVSKLDYKDFYHMMSSIDLLVPAFASDIYISKKISSSIPLGISCRVPILANERLLRSYSFLREPAVVLRPSGMSEVGAIAALRRGAKPWTEGFEEGMPTTLLPPAKAPDTRSKHVEWNHKKLRAGSADREWDLYHESLLDINSRTMLGMLRKAKRRLLDVEGRIPLEADDQGDLK